MVSISPDIVVRISLVSNGTSLHELNPPVYRIFKVSSSINLELLHDKVIAPIMGWERNYHTYYFRAASPRGEEETAEIKAHGVKMNFYDGPTDEQGNATVGFTGDEFHGPMTTLKRDCIHYVQTKTTASDAMHVGGFVDQEYIKDPEKATIGELLKQVGDRCLYNYDLGDCWYHCLEVQKVIPAEDEEADGAVVIYDGSMRCPDEDGEGCEYYQRKVLDLLVQTMKDANDHVTARKLADACFDRRHALNVMGPFRPLDFDLSERRAALASALGSRNSTRSTKQFTNGRCFGEASIGQKHLVCKKEDDRFDHMGGYMIFNETVNVKPDVKGATLCYNCGTPNKLKACSRCESAFYCGRDCQSNHWDVSHKKQCKKEKAAYEKYCVEVERNIPDPTRFNNDGPVYRYKKYDRNNLRFRVGDFVECMLGENEWGTGRIVKLCHREPNWPVTHPFAPYQIKLDRETANRVGISFQQAFIYCLWDDDYQIRKLKMPEKKNGVGKGKKKRK
uniref:MYND-type domain-containing protein n=1 Tax=Stephanocyclus meneghinianus TaxID=29205 RepID=A0A7S1KMC9_STEMN|mmetsp:Transcript_101/g.114  ORF Transcript_101/g.114 Transcript_101/m.114 type:complete len:505 (+) Transcript_101:92-1606(+)|eukprot:scaffold89266_cov62-Cyclotella_meneghiniana.AAC.3